MKCNDIFPFPMNVRVCQIFGLRVGSFRFYSKSQTRNPYDVLGLKHTSSIKDVKKAYIKLCKELHPDMKPGDVAQHKKFIELNEAYLTLLNSEKRKNINCGAYRNPDIYWHTPNPKEKKSEEETNWQSQRVWKENEEYEELRRRYSKTAMKNNRIANLWIITGCVILMIVGSFLYASAYSYAVNYNREKVDEKSRRLSDSYKNLRKHVMSKETTEHIDDMKKRWTE